MGKGSLFHSNSGPPRPLIRPTDSMTKRVRAKKALGQHFLHDESVAERIAEILVSRRDLPILEVGPGMGVLTKYLLSIYRDTVVVELDGESVEYLRETFPELQGDRLIEGDFLTLPLDRIFPEGQPFLLIGNYPYNISSQIFFHMLEYRDLIPMAGGMLQREVARRLTSEPGTRDYGILTVLLRAWYDAEYLFTVPPGAFTPPPKVQSGVLRLTRNDRTSLGVSEQSFRRVVKAAFAQRRKMIRSSLRGLLPESIPPEIERYLTMRPEQLDVEDFIALTRAVDEKTICPIDEETLR